MAAKSGESRAGLVVFLVLFILLSITLGVMTYLGFDGQKALETKAAEAEKKAKDWESDANFQKTVANTYRVYLGYPPPAGDDVGALRKEYGSGAGAKDKAKAEEHKKLIDTLDKSKKWDDAVKKPGESYLEEIERLKTEKADALKAMAKANDEKEKANADAEKAKRELTAANTVYQQKLDQQKNTDNKEVEGLRATVTQLQEDLKAASSRPLKALEDQKKEITDVGTENKRLTKELANALKTIRDRGDEMARTQATAEFDVSKIAPESLAKIVSINSTGDMPYISLGSADNLKRQVTFSIYGKGLDGKPLRTPKGKLEVIRVIDDHRAQARITDLRDERRDPVLPGDFLYNPAWNPSVKQHVVIIGNIDLTGDRRDSVQEFIRTLKNQNVDVDAFMDMKTKKLLNANGDGPGEITRRTDLLIVGDGPDFGAGPVKAGDPKTDAKNDVLTAMQKFQDEAERFGVRIVRLSTFLEMSGYPLPKSMGTEKGKIGFQRNLDAAGSPVERRDPPK